MDHMVNSFLEKFEGESRNDAEELLDLARYSYQLRDDDNIYLGQIQKHLDIAVEKGTSRLSPDRYNELKNQV